MDTRNIERKIAIGARLITLLATMASTLGAVIMIVIGLEDTLLAVSVQLRAEAGPLPPGDATAIRIISALDRFLMAIVLLYFAYGVYVLFVRPGKSTEELGIPNWLRIEGIGQLKQTVAELIVVVLFVLFLRVAVETFVAHGPGLTYEELLKLLTLPVAIFLLAAALKLAELHPKKGADAGDRTGNKTRPR